MSTGGDWRAEGAHWLQDLKMPTTQFDLERKWGLGGVNHRNHECLGGAHTR